MNVVRMDARPVAAAQPAGSEASPAADRARLLLRDARVAAIEHLDLLQASLGVVRDLSLEVQDGGDAFAVGVRELAARMAEDVLWRAKALEALTARERAGLLAH